MGARRSEKAHNTSVPHLGCSPEPPLSTDEPALETSSLPPMGGIKRLIGSSLHLLPPKDLKLPRGALPGEGAPGEGLLSGALKRDWQEHSLVEGMAGVKTWARGIRNEWQRVACGRNVGYQ